MLVSLEIPPVLNVSNHPILLYTTACSGFGLSAPPAPRPRNYYFLLPLVISSSSYFLLVFIYLLTSLTHPSLVWSLYRIYAFPCAFVCALALPYCLMALWPYAIVVFTHSFYYYYGFFLERMSGASIDTYPFIYYLYYYYGPI